MVAGYFVPYAYISLTWKGPERLCGLCCVMLCLLLRLLCQPGENKRVCSSYGSSRFLPASYLALAYPGFTEQCAQCE